MIAIHIFSCTSDHLLFSLDFLTVFVEIEVTHVASSPLISMTLVMHLDVVFIWVRTEVKLIIT